MKSQNKLTQTFHREFVCEICNVKEGRGSMDRWNGNLHIDEIRHRAALFGLKMDIKESRQGNHTTQWIVFAHYSCILAGAALKQIEK